MDKYWPFYLKGIYACKICLVYRIYISLIKALAEIVILFSCSVKVVILCILLLCPFSVIFCSILTWASLKIYLHDFQNCSNNPNSSIVCRVQKMKELFLKAYTTLTSDGHHVEAIQRFMLAQRLYYRVMEAMLNFVSLFF